MRLRVIIGSALLVGLIVPSALAGAIGEMGINVGGIFPQGDYARYADPGLSFLLRVNPHISKAQTSPTMQAASRESRGSGRFLDAQGQPTARGFVLTAGIVATGRYGST